MVYGEVDRSHRRFIFDDERLISDDDRPIFDVDHGTHKKRVRSSRQISSERQRQFGRPLFPNHVVACVFDLYVEAIGDPRLPIESWTIGIEGLIDR